jgi:hypothetical protein
VKQIDSSVLFLSYGILSANQIKMHRVNILKEDFSEEKEALVADDGLSSAKAAAVRKEQDQPPVIVCGMSLAGLGRTGQFIACSFSIFFFFVLYGYLQEWIFSFGDFK